MKLGVILTIFIICVFGTLADRVIPESFHYLWGYVVACVMFVVAGMVDQSLT